MEESTRTIITVVVAAFVLMVVVVGAVGFYYYQKTTKPVTLAKPKTVETTPTNQTTPEPTTSTVEVPKLIKPVVGVISDVLGGIDCSDDSKCFEDSAVDGCKKARVIVYTPKVTQVREIKGEKGGKCVIDYEVTSVTSFGTPDLMGLKMTCKLSPTDITNNPGIVSNPFQAEQPGCSGSLWDKFQFAPKA